MSRVDEIEAAIDDLPATEYRRTVEWFRKREQDRWNLQLDSHSNEGKLDFLFDEGESEFALGQLREWPPQE